MPTFTSPSSPATSSTFLTNRMLPPSAATDNISPEQRQQLTQRIFNSRYQENRGVGVFEQIAGIAASSVIDLGDTLASNQLLPLADRGDVWNLVGDYGGEIGYELENFYNRNQASVEVVSGLAGAIGTGYLGGAMLLPRISNAMARTTAISSSRLWQAGARANAATRANMLAAQAEAAATGEAFSVWGSSAGRSYLANRTGAVAGQALFEEGVIAATMNSNSMIWSDDMSENLFWGAAGVGIGGFLGGIGARFEMRRLANDPSQIKARADAADPQGMMRILEQQPDLQWLQRSGGVEGLESAKFTALMLTARQELPANATPEMRSRLDDITKNAYAQATESFQKIASKGVKLVPGTSFALKDSKLAKHVDVMRGEDPTVFFGLESFGSLEKKNLEMVLDEFSEGVDSLKKSQVAEQIRLGRVLEDQQAMLVVDRKLMPASTPEAKDVSKFHPDRLDFQQTTKGLPEFKFKAISNGKTRVVNESFDVKNFDILPLTDKLQAVEGLKRVMQTMIRNNEPFKTPKNPTWLQLDAAVHFENLGGTVEWRNSPFKNKEEAITGAYKLKDSAIGNLPSTKPLGDFWNRLAYNLPLPDSLERIYDGAGDSLRAVLDSATQGATYADLVQLRQKMKGLHGFDVKDRGDDPLFGNLFKFNRNEKDEWLDMGVGFFRNEKYLKPLSQYSIAEMMAEWKASRFHALHQFQGSGGFVDTLTDLLHSTPAFRNSMNMRGLADDQITGVGSFGSQAVGEVLTREMRYRDSAVMLDLLRTREMVNRESDAALQAVIQRHLGTTVVELNAAPAAGSKVLVNQFLSNSLGWDLRPSEVGLSSGHFGFVLADTAANADRLGRPVQKGERLQNPKTQKDIVVDALGLRFLKGIGKINEHIRIDQNRIRAANGMTLLKQKPWYVPSLPTKGMFVGFVFDADNQILPNSAVIAKTRGEFDSLRKERMANMPAGSVFRTRESVQEFADAYDKAAMDWMDAGSVVSPAKGQRGVLATEFVNPNAIEDYLEWTKRQFEGIGTGVMRTLYDTQLGIAANRSAVERSTRGLKAKAIGKNINDRIRTIWDEYEATVRGQNLGDTQRSISGSLMHPIESIFNGTIETIWPAMSWMAPSQLARWTGELMNRVGLQAPRASRTFGELSRQLGPHIPFASAQDYAEQTLKIQRPPEVRKIAEKINWLSASILLRAFELPHAAMNLVGVMTTMPSIARNGRAPITSSYKTRNGNVNIVDTYRILAQAIGDMTTDRRLADWKVMERNGDSAQSVAEFTQQMAAIKDRGSFGRIMLGTGHKQGATGAKGVFKEKGIDGLISIATDTTESWSRAYSHFVGLRLADYHGIVGEQARHGFAREIANAAIANYNPLNRPELYQSAFGSMFGLFMSWMQSYNQRLFRWMEEGDYKAVGRQLAMQSTLFGLTSMPGYDLVEKTLLSAGIGETVDGQEATLTDHIYAKFGPVIGSALAHGGIAQTGVVLYTRGDMNYRDVTLDPSRLMAGIGVTGSAVTAIDEVLTSLFASSSLGESQRLAEIATRNMPNRVLKGLLVSIANDGLDVDARGQIVSENRNFFESALRMTGLRSHRQQAEIEAFYANKQLQQREAARMDVLRNETRSLLRTEGWENRLQEVFDKYIQTGGRPEHFRTWIRDQVRSATSTRGLNAMAKAISNPKNHQEIWRYDMYGGN